MRKAIVIAALLALGACAAPDNRKFYKDGADFADYQRDLYACERDVRMAVPSGVYSQSVYASMDAQSFFIRCMAAHGWSFM